MLRLKLLDAGLRIMVWAHRPQERMGSTICRVDPVSSRVSGFRF